MNTPRNLILAAAAAAGLVAVSLPAVASADCYERRSDNRAAGTILGAVIGGGLGSSLAHGSSRGAGTVAGALVGGAIGNSVAGSRDCYYGDRRSDYYDSGYAYDDDYYGDPGYGRTTVYVEPRREYYYTPGYNYYGRSYYRPHWNHRGW